MSLMICCRCKAGATFTSPKDFCDEHWARWWGGFDPELPYEDGDGPNEEMFLEALEMIRSGSMEEKGR